MELNLQYFGHLMRKAESLERTLMPGKIEVVEESGRGWVGYIASLIQWMCIWANSGRQWRCETRCETWCDAIHRVTKSGTWLRDWTTLRDTLKIIPSTHLKVTMKWLLWGFPGGSDGQESACNVDCLGREDLPKKLSIPIFFPGEAWWATVHGVAKSRAWLWN